MATTNLEAAYRATAYNVDDGEIRLVLRVDEHSHELDVLLNKLGADQWAFITAWNPRSKPASASSNDVANELLRARVRPYAVFEGEGVAADGKWRERSFLVVGLAMDAAHALAVEFQQTAFLYGRRGSAAQLVFTAFPEEAGT